MPDSGLSSLWYLSLPLTRQDLTQGQMTRKSNYSGGFGMGRYLSLYSLFNIYLSIPPDRTWQKVKWPEGRIIMEIRRGEGRTQVDARALLDYAGHRPTWCNVGLMSLAGHRPSGWSNLPVIISERHIGSLALMQIRQINLPVSHLPETYGSYAPSRFLYFF